MRVLIFGSSGMIGRGLLRECILDAGVKQIVLVGRSELDVRGPQIVQHIVKDLNDISSLQSALTGVDACFWSLGVASAGMDEAAYTRITYDYAVNAAKLLVQWSPLMTFVFVSGGGTDANSRLMWARVKGTTENAILAMPFAKSFAVRPGFILPVDGIKSRTAMYNFFYGLSRPIFPLLRKLGPGIATDTRELGRAMLRLARNGHAKRVLEQRDLNELANQ